VIIRYSPVTSTWPGALNGSQFVFANAATSTMITNFDLSQSVNWYAYAELYDASPGVNGICDGPIPGQSVFCTGALLATSSIRHFLVPGSQNPYLPPDNGTLCNSPTSTIPALYVTCNNSFTLFSSTTLEDVGCKLKQISFQVVACVIVPHNSTTDFIQNSFTKFQAVPPFSVFYGIQNGISQGASTTMSSASSSQTWNFELGGSTIPLTIGTSTLHESLGDTLTDLWFTTIRLLLWLATIFGIWNMVRLK